jgi:hypothetical protein
MRTHSIVKYIVLKWSGGTSILELSQKLNTGTLTNPPVTKNMTTTPDEIHYSYGAVQMTVFAEKISRAGLEQLLAMIARRRKEEGDAGIGFGVEARVRHLLQLMDQEEDGWVPGKDLIQ